MNRNITLRKKMEEKLFDYQKQLKRLLAEISMTKEKERKALAAQLHDSLIQEYAILRMKLGAISKMDSLEPDIATIIKESDTLLKKMIKETRNLTYELSPPILQFGLIPSLEWLVDNFKERFKLHIEMQQGDNLPVLPETMNSVLFQSVRESLMNIIKHAQATHVSISVCTSNNCLQLTIEDNGIGFAPEERSINELSGGFGLLNIREQIEFLGGNFSIHSEKEKGTRIEIVIPLNGM